MADDSYLAQMPLQIGEERCRAQFSREVLRSEEGRGDGEVVGHSEPGEAAGGGEAGPRAPPTHQRAEAARWRGWRRRPSTSESQTA